MTTLATLTPKQQQVYGLLEKGLKPPEIARRLKITGSGVYGHMRGIRKLGVTLPNEQVTNNGTGDVLAGADATPTAIRRTQTPEQFLDAEINALKDQFGKIDDEIAVMGATIELRQAEKAELETRLDKLQAACKALA